MRVISVIMGTLTLPFALLVAVGSPTEAAGCTILGTEGDDVLTGTRGPDRICGLGGNDRLRGLGGGDVLRGGGGRDVLAPGPGSNTVRGGSGEDTVSYVRLPVPVMADLRLGTVLGGVDDALAGVENVVGTRGPDGLAGDDGDNRILGRGGDDVVVGTFGSDAVSGGAGTDAITYGYLQDEYYNGVLVDLASGRLHVGTAGDEGTIAGVENASGTSYADFLYGDEGGNILRGGRDDDWIDGRGGIDTMDGGSDEDLLFWGPGGTAADPELVSGGPGWDQVRSLPSTWAVTASMSASEGPDGWHVELDDGLTYLVAEVDELTGSPWADSLHIGGGAREVTIYGGGGADDIDTTDGHGGDWVMTSDTDPPSACVGDPDDILEC